MKIIKFLIALAITLVLAFACNMQLRSPDLPFAVPPLGKLLNPFTGFWQNAESGTGFSKESLDLPELIAPVMVQYDDRMVPHIFAQNIQDALFVQGYVTAQHRLFQMDFGVRYGAGRLSEVLGEQVLNPRTGTTALDTDKLQRRRGLFLAAEKAVEKWKENKEGYELLSAYSKGVNAYIRSLKPKDYPVEFKLMDYAPEPWTNVHSALIIKNMALVLCSRANDVESSNALNYFGEEEFNFLFPEYNPKQKPIIPSGTPWNFDTIQVIDNQPVEEMIGSFDHKMPEKPYEGIGSNNWAVSGSKTASGNPILCSDPHLHLTLPSVWYELQIHTPEMNVYGVSLPGLPGVIIGFNENIAWGQTNVGQDVLDWYRIKWADESKEKYILDGEEKEVGEIVNVFKVRYLDEPVRDTVKTTVWGPIVHDKPGDLKQDLAMKWAGLKDPNPKELDFINLLNRGKNYEDYSKALLNYESPAQNFAFASKEGDVAIKVNGKFPLRREGQGRFVQDGSDSKNDWAGFIPMTQVPQIKNPSRGFIASANQHSTDPSYPYYYFGGFDDYRGRHLVESLTKRSNMNARDMMELQNDNYSIFAEEASELLLRNLDTASLNFIQKSALKQLQNWDFRFEKDGLAPVLFTEWWSEFENMTWDEIYVFDDSIDMIDPEPWRTLEILDTLPNSRFFDITTTEKIENAGAVATLSFVKMCNGLSDKLKDPTYNWSKHKSTIISHVAQFPAFSSKPVDVGGYRQALNAISERHGPSWRMIVEQGEEVKAYGVYPGGQSGNPGSPYFDNMLNSWAEGKYYELLFMNDEKDTRQQIIFSQKFF